MDRKDDPVSEGYAPASFEKRTAAWMGIAYPVMLCFVLNYAIYTGGRELPGTFPLFLVPVSVALAVVTIRRMKLHTCRRPFRRGRCAASSGGW